MHHNIRIISFLLFLLFSFQIYGQSENSFEPKIIPPSPTAYELGRYGQTDVGTFTGTPNISVPLYTYKTKNIAIPISLGYNSNGIQVDQMETNVGLGWNLNVGGVINRVVRGKPDENRNGSISEDMYCSDSFFTYLEANEFNDLQPDLYSYNFNGQSGQFVFDNSGKAVFVSQNNLKIERLNGITSGFKITTEEGIQYQFYDTEFSTWENVEAPQTIITGWYLSKITHPEGDVINFTYKDSNYGFVSSISESFGIKVQQESGCDPNVIHSPSNRMENYLSIMGKTIESISSNESQFGSVSFQQTANPNIVGNYLISGIKVFDARQNIVESADFNYLFTTNKRIFLSECIFKDSSKRYSFEYEAPDDLVARLSDQKDLWGYYNGKPGTYPDAIIHKDLYPQTDLVKNALAGRSSGDKRPYVDYAKKGILKKIVYPTKGYNEFEYESNSVWETINTCETETKNFWFYNPGYNREEKTETFVFENKSNYDSEIQARVSYNDYDLTPGTFPVGELWISFTVENLTNPVLNSVPITADEHNKPKKLSYTFLKNNTYKITIVFSPDAKTTGQVNFTYCKGGGDSKTNVPVAGLRIAKISSFDTNINKADVKYYYYGKKETPNISTGVKGVQISLLTNTEIRRICQIPNIPFSTVEDIAVFMNVNANSVYPLYRSMGNSSTTYENITVSYGGANFENGGEEFSYHISADIPPYLCLDSQLTSSPWTNAGWNNGLLSKKIIFKKILSTNKLIPLKIIENKYKLQDQYTRKIQGIATDSKYAPVLFFPTPNYKNIQHLNIAKYTTNSYWFYLESEENAQYDLEGLNPVTTKTEYKYNNPQHKKLTSQIFTNSLNEKLETKYFYPQDPEMATEPLRNELIAKNMIGLVLDTQTLREGNKLSEQKTIYDQSSATSNLLLPRFIGVNKGVNAVDLNLDKKIAFDQYDEKGNILQYTLESGIPVSIIWGYNKTQPIAKIENLAYNLIPSGTITNLQTLSNADNDNCMSRNCTEQLLRNGLNAFRNSLPNAFISTYTYNPLVGVTSVTDPKGIASFYEYNAYGRLKFVKDKDLNVLQKYCYNYKGQQVDCSDNSSSSVILYKSSARSGSFTKNNCASGGVGSNVVYSQAEGTSTSTISQADADSKGLALFNTNGQANANTNGTCTFSSIARSGSFTKNNCTSGGVGSSVAFSQAAGAQSSTVSQADADSKGLALFNINGQANANTNGTCTFSSIARSGSFTKNNCAAGGVGSSVVYTVPAGRYSSTSSQAAADALAQTDVTDNGQAYANANGYCTFTSVAKSGSFTKNNCTAGGVGSSVVYTVPAGRYSSTSSQAAADALAQTDVTNNGQANANTYGDCTFRSAAISGTFKKNTCVGGSVGSYVGYALAEGAIVLKTSQADVDSKALSKLNAEGQANANASGQCLFYNVYTQRSIRRTYCPRGTNGTVVIYSVSPGTYSSLISQADANQQAESEIDRQGQGYADRNGVCNPGDIEEI